MLALFIILGAVFGGILFQSIKFSLLGALLGFLLAKIEILSRQVRLLKNSINQLTNQFNASSSNISQQQHRPEDAPHDFAQQDDQQTDQPAAKSTTSEKTYLTYSTASIAKSSSEDVAEISTQDPAPLKNTQIQAASSKGSDHRPVQQSASHLDKPSNNNHNDNNTTPRSVAKQPPDFVTKAVNFVIDYFTHGNIVVKVGAVVLFFGVAFLLKYAAENSNIPMKARLIAVAVGAIILLLFGWRLKNKKQGYGLVLQGAAVGILYLTLFASFRLYHMVPSAFAFALLIVFSGLAMLLAALQNARSLAILSVTGGFLAPVLTSTGSGNHIGLFSYYAVLNIGIFAMAWFKSWRLLNLIGFVFTFLIGTAWGVIKYQASDFLTTEPFLILFFILYTGIALLFAIKQKPSLKGYVDTSLIFGLPLISFALQAAMVKDYEFGLAWSAFSLAAFYLIIAGIILKGKNDYLKVIAEAFLALGIIFISLVIPFALDGKWTAAAWAIEGAGLVWVGLRQSRWFPKYFGTLIQLVGGIFFLADIHFNDNREIIFDAETIGIIFVAVAGLFSSFQIWRRRETLPSFERIAYLLFLIWAMLWWYIGIISKITSQVNDVNLAGSIVLFVSLSGLGWYALEKRLNWNVLSQLTWVSLSLVVFSGLGYAAQYLHLMVSWSAAFWVFTIISFYWCLFHRENSYRKKQIQLAEQKDEQPSNSQPLWMPQLPVATPVLHFIALLALMTFCLLETGWTVDYFDLTDSAWGIGILGLLAAFWLYLLAQFNRWPMTQHITAYRIAGLTVAILVAVMWMFFVNIPHSGGTTALIYIPLFNPLDIAQALVLMLLFKSIQKLSQVGVGILDQVANVVMAVFVFIWLNVIVLRSLHAWFNIPYEFFELYHSFLVQTSLSIFWTLLGLAGTIFGTRNRSRKVWIYAASLVGVVVAKLFIIDLDNSSSIERIVSFVVVGLLLLVVGYFSPLPPKNNVELNKSDDIKDVTIQQVTKKQP